MFSGVLSFEGCILTHRAAVPPPLPWGGSTQSEPESNFGAVKKIFGYS